MKPKLRFRNGFWFVEGPNIRQNSTRNVRAAIRYLLEVS